MSGGSLFQCNGAPLRDVNVQVVFCYDALTHDKLGECRTSGAAAFQLLANQLESGESCKCKCRIGD